MLNNYDPNIWDAVHVVRVTLTMFNYVGHVAFEIGGNCRGKDILESGLDFLEDPGVMNENDCQFTFHEDEEEWTAVLKNPDGDELTIEESDFREIERMITAIEIVEHNPR